MVRYGLVWCGEVYSGRFGGVGWGLVRCGEVYSGRCGLVE